MSIRSLILEKKWLITITLFCNCLLWIFVKPELNHLLLSIQKTGEAPEFINFFFPRLETEIHRLPISFFADKIFQTFIRLSILSTLIPFLPSFIKKINSRNVDQKWMWNSVRLFHISITIICFPWLVEIPKLSTLNTFYSPAGILNTVETLPSYTLLFGSIYLFYFLNILVIIKPKNLYFSFLTSFLFLFNYGLIQSFGKTDHGYSTITYCLLLTPFLRLNNINKGGLFYFIQLTITACYFMAGLEKITTSGMNWLNGSTLRFYLSMSDNSIAQIISTQNWLCSILSVFVILFQIGFIFSLTKKEVKIKFMACGLGFHWGITFLMGINIFLINPWLMSYILLFPQTKKELKKAP